jgi:hypothetical protein
MITLNLDWREVLWWLQGGMAGSHIRWSVYKDMVDRVWLQCTEQERRNIWLIMRRDLGGIWRPSDFNGYDLANAHGEGSWRPESEIFDRTPWMYFRKVLARFDPENQYAVMLSVKDRKDLSVTLLGLGDDSILDAPKHYIKDHPYVTVRAYLWKAPSGEASYYVDWDRRCAEDRIIRTERMDIPNTGIM